VRVNDGNALFPHLFYQEVTEVNVPLQRRLIRLEIINKTITTVEFQRCGLKKAFQLGSVNCGLENS
jgi:hypothetical protein